MRAVLLLHTTPPLPLHATYVSVLEGLDVDKALEMVKAHRRLDAQGTSRCLHVVRLLQQLHTSLTLSTEPTIGQAQNMEEPECKNVDAHLKFHCC